MATPDSGSYRTSDLYFSAYLKVSGVPFQETTREEGRVVFLFEPMDSKVMRDLKQQYFSGSAKVSALDYMQSIKVMKSLTHM